MGGLNVAASAVSGDWRGPFSDAFPCLAANEIDGEALVALQHEDLKGMGINSVGHRLTILKSVYDVKKAQDIPIESDHYVPLCKFVDPCFFEASTRGGATPDMQHD